MTVEVLVFIGAMATGPLEAKPDDLFVTLIFGLLKVA